MSAQRHQSNPHILGRRTLQQDHRILAAILLPGMSVLDVGCGTGAITIGIARAVEPGGHVMGIDRDDGLLDLARQRHARQSNLQFARADITAFSIDRQFEVVTAARTLQWVSTPDLAVGNMVRACKPGGTILVLDYSHEMNRWEPAPPAEFMHFYRAFLSWRSDNGWDNRMADHLPALFRVAGLQHIQVHAQDEITSRGEPDFSIRAMLWSEVIDNVSPQLAGASYCTASELQSAREAYSKWAHTHLQLQRLAMRAVMAQVPLQRSPTTPE